MPTTAVLLHTGAALRALPTSSNVTQIIPALTRSGDRW